MCRSDVLQRSCIVQPTPTCDGAKIAFLVEGEAQISDEELINGMEFQTAVLWKNS